MLGDAQTGKLKGFLQHHTAPNLFFWLQKRLEYAQDWAIHQNRQGKKSSFFKVILNPAWAFFKQYVLDGRFLQGRYGFVYAQLFAQYTFNKYALWYDCQHNQAEQAFAYTSQQAKNLPAITIQNKQSTLSLVMIVKNEAKHLAASDKLLRVMQRAIIGT